MDEDPLLHWWGHPPEWAYGQDPIVPVAVEHRLEFGDPQHDADGRPQFGFEYNFLVYRFRDGESAAEAVHYLDEPDHVRVRFHDAVEARSAFARRVLVFLSLRYTSIGLDPTDPALLAEVRAWRDEHRRQDPLGRT